MDQFYRLLDIAELPELKSETIVHGIFYVSNGVEYNESLINSETLSNFKVALTTIKMLSKNKEFIVDIKENPIKTLQTPMNVYQEDIWASESKRANAELDSNICFPNSARICDRCKKYTVHEQKVQARSSDEGFTMIYDCCECGWHHVENI